MNKKLFFSFMAGILTLAGCSSSNSESTNIDSTSKTEMTETSENIDSTAMPTEANESTEEVAISMKGETEKIDEDWNRYTNHELGFSIEYPSMTYGYQGEPEGSEVTVIEDGNIVYLSDGHHEEEIEQKKDKSEIEKASGIPFAFLVRDISNDEALDNFIKERYGENCALGEKEESAVKGVFNVSFANLDLSCFVNYITLIKYSPEKSKVATWDIGQDTNFYQKDLTSLDSKISESFKFL